MIKNYKDEKFELFDNIKLDYNLCNKIEQKFNNGLDLKITIEDLFKIIDYDKDKEELSISVKMFSVKNRIPYSNSSISVISSASKGRSSLLIPVKRRSASKNGPSCPNPSARCRKNSMA